MPEQLRLLVSKVRSLFPNAACARFGEAIEWRRDDASSEDWRPFVISRPMIREPLLYNYTANARDVAGCLRSVLRDDELTEKVRSRLGPDFAN